MVNRIDWGNFVLSAWGTSPAVVYITEIARADIRGSLISSAPAYASLGKLRILFYTRGRTLLKMKKTNYEMP